MKRLRASTIAVRSKVWATLFGAFVSASAVLTTPAPALAQESPAKPPAPAPQRLVMHVESVGIDASSVRPLVRAATPKDAVILDSTDFLKSMRDKGQTEPLGNAYGTPADRLALLERMRTTASDLKIDGVVLALMIATPKRRAVRLVVQYASETDPSLDKLVELELKDPSSDGAKIDAVLRPVLEQYKPPPPPPAPATATAPAPAVALKPDLTELGGKKPFPWTLKVGLNVHLDAYALLGPGVNEYQRADGSGLTSGAEVRRVRPNVNGSFGDHFYYLFHLDFAGSNGNGANQSFAFRGGSSHAWIAYKHSDALNIQFGQFPEPFTFENLRPNMMLDFMDISRVLALATPNGIDTGAMVFGTPGRFSYGVGLFNGEGKNRIPTDSHGEATERATVSFNQEGSNRLRVGVSGRQGFVDPARIYGEAPNVAFTTTRGYTFWTPNYTLNGGVAPGLVVNPLPVSVLPSGPQHSYAADLETDVGDFSLQAEAAYVLFDTREVGRAAPDVENTIRTGQMKGIVYYATLGYWVFGATKTLKNLRWDEKIFKLGGQRDEEPFQPSLLLLARWQQMLLTYDSKSRSVFGTEPGLIDRFTRNLRTDILSLEATAWLSARFSLLTEWSMYVFPASEVKGAPYQLDNQALAPGATIAGQRGTRAPVNNPTLPVAVESYFKSPDPSARSFHEISLRARLWF